MGTRCADHVTPLYPQKLALTLPTGGGRSVNIVRSRTKTTEFFFKWRSWNRNLPETEDFVILVHHIMKEKFNVNYLNGTFFLINLCVP